MAQGWQPGHGYGQPQQQPPPPPPPAKSNTGLIIGIVFGVLFAIGAGIAIISYLAISGVKKYTQSAKTSEAKNNIGAIARNAMYAYESEQPMNELVSEGATREVESHVLCKSAKPVPTEIPKGRKYQPSPQDFKSTRTEGWTCLRFEFFDPSYYQYDYRVGGGYKGPKRGGPDPGPDGFEASAEGDLDGDGTTSLFTITGKVDKVTRTVKLSPMWSDDEDE